MVFHAFNLLIILMPFACNENHVSRLCQHAAVLMASRRSVMLMVFCMSSYPAPPACR